MSRIRTACLAAAIAGLLVAPGLTLADDAISAPAVKTIGKPASPPKAQIEPSLIVMNSRGASLAGTTLTLTGVSPNAIIFADRPVRAAGHALTAHLLQEWGGTGKDSFAADPPNATVSVLSSDGSSVSDAVVVLKSPKLDGDNLTFDVEVLEGDLKNADGPASVFIDIIGLPFTPRSFAGVARRTAYRGAFYAGAAVGAAAAAYPYYPPPPAYYPPPAYPPPAYYPPPPAYYPPYPRPY